MPETPVNPVPGASESPVSKDPSAKPAATRNANQNNLMYYAAGVMESYLYQRADGNLTRVEALDNGVAVEVYGPDFQILTSKTVQKEGESFGGFFAGSNYNFLIFGNDNASSSDSREVVRVVKYSKDWERLGQAGLKGANTAIPFDAGCLRCAELNGYLYINTSHEMYNGHQANMLIAVRQSDMEIVSSRTGVSNINTGYVSHSFNQFILAASDGSLVTLDHGDAYPRAAVAVRYNVSGGKPTAAKYVNLVSFPGAVGENDTNASFGGFEESSSHFLAVGNTGPSGGRSAVVYAVSKSGFDQGSVKSYTLAGGGCFTPQLVKISDNRFLALWNSGSSLMSDALNYIFLDASGAPIGSVQTAKAFLSDCQPIVAGGKVIWYATGCWYTSPSIAAAPTFYTIDASSGAFSSAGAGSAGTPETPAAPSTPATPAAPSTPGKGNNPFTDVPDGTYYHDAVLWALENGVTTGVTADHFQPTAACTRGQVATFLWRAKGSPEPQTKTNPFQDVFASSPFYKAILWAYENGITTGATATTFNPNGTCTSGHVVTFLWRAEGKPEASGASGLASAYAGQYYTDAVAWADTSGLLTGVGGAFVPSQMSPRADIVTYLYRNLAQ